MYQQYIDGITKQPYPNGIKRIADNAFIPFDPANTDAQQFAKWLQEGNLPEPAEEGGTVAQEWAVETIAKLLPNG
jgi:hypothetical protein